jgi:hypothetical protein
LSPNARGLGILDRVSDAGATVPTLCRLEVTNAFQSAIRRKRITAPYRDQSLAELTQMPINFDADTNVYAWTTRRCSPPLARPQTAAARLDGANC